MIDSSAWPAIPHLGGEDDEDRRLLREMGREALAYVASFDWAPPVKRAALALGVGGVLTLFLIEFACAVEDGADTQLWVVVGDLPAAYFVTDHAPDAASAIAIYCELMEDWAGAVLDGGDLAEAYPVKAAPTAKNAHDLRNRITFIRRRISNGRGGPRGNVRS